MIIALIILVLAVIAYLIISVLTDDPIPKDDYCYNCKYGFCMEIPKSKTCMKWQEELHDKRRSDFDKHGNICS